MPEATLVALTGNTILDGLLGTRKWATADLTYSFPTSGSYYGTGYGSGQPTTGFGALSGVQQAAVLEVLAEYASVANLRFTALAETLVQHGDLRYAMSDVTKTAFAYYPTSYAEGGDVWLNRSSGAYNTPVKGNYAYTTLLHETGHALGLEHPHESGMPVDRDAMQYTVMSYRSYVGGSTSSGYTNEAWGYAQSLMRLDIAAVQHLYGANFTTRSGDTVYSWSPATGQNFIDGVAQSAPGGNRIFQTVWDGGGTDTYDFSNYGTALTVNLEPGAWTLTSTVQRAHLGNGQYAPGTIANAYQYRSDPRSLIENASGGSAGDQIAGNGAANTLWGQGGADTLTGGLGNDVLNGGDGSDTAKYAGVSTAYSWIQNSDGTWTVAGADGTDHLLGIEVLQFSDQTVTIGTVSTTSAVMPDSTPTATPPAIPPITPPVTPSAPVVTNPVVASVSLTGTALADTLTGSALGDTLSGLGGLDVLSGLAGDDLLVGGADRDTLQGGAGADRFDFDSVRDSSPGSKKDVIVDFERGVDTIDLSTIDASRDAGGNQRFKWSDKADLDAAFTGRDGQLRFDNGILMGDTNGDSKADFQIKIAGSLLAADVLL